MRELALFAGGGGGILGGLLLGWRTVCAVEIDPYARSVLLARQRDGMLQPFPIWDDVSTFDGKPWRGHVDVISGGFPCQDISCAGKGAGIDGERSGLWSEFARIIREVRPRYAFIENSPMLAVRGLDRVLADLAAMGMSAEWGVVSAADVGAPHKRDRIWIVAQSISARAGYFCGETGSNCRRDAWRNESALRQAHWPDGANWPDSANTTSTKARDVADAQGERRGEARELRRAESAQRASGGGEAHADAERKRLERIEQGRAETWATDRPGNGRDSSGWPAEPDICRVVNGLAKRMDRLKALGNGQVPRVAATAWRILSERLDEKRHEVAEASHQQTETNEQRKG